MHPASFQYKLELDPQSWVSSGRKTLFLVNIRASKIIRITVISKNWVSFSKTIRCIRILVMGFHIEYYFWVHVPEIEAVLFLDLKPTLSPSSSSPEESPPSVWLSIVFASQMISSGIIPISWAFSKSIWITDVWSLKSLSDPLLFSFFPLVCMRFGVSTMARLDVPILLSSDFRATLAINFTKYCKEDRWEVGSKIHRSNTAIVCSFFLPSKRHFKKQSCSWFVRSGSGSSRKNCFSKLATSWGGAVEIWPPSSIIFCERNNGNVIHLCGKDNNPKKYD